MPSIWYALTAPRLQFAFPRREQLPSRFSHVLTGSRFLIFPHLCLWLCGLTHVPASIAGIDPFLPISQLRKMHNCPGSFRRGPEMRQQKHMLQHNVNKVHVAFIYYYYCFICVFAYLDILFSLSLSLCPYMNSVELRTIKDDKGTRRCWDSGKQWRDNCPACGERYRGKSGECKRKSDSSTSSLFYPSYVTAQCDPSIQRFV